jgi:hypothetical protein
LRAIGCVAAGFSLLLAASCGGGDGADSSIAIHGGTPEQRALLQSIGDGLAPTGIRSVAVRTIEVVGFPSKTWVELRAEPRSNGSVSPRARWEALVIAGAFRDRSAEQNLGEVRYLDGTQIAAGSPDRDPSPEAASAAERIGIARAVARSADEQHAAVEQLDVLTPAGPAVVLVLRVGDPAAFVKHRVLPLLELWWTSARLEGGYLLVEDADGRLVYERYFSSRIPASGGRVRPELAGCDPVGRTFANPNVAPPPPCPA